MDKTKYFKDSSEFLFNNGFYIDAISRRYYMLLHMMCDSIELQVKKIPQDHKKIRDMFVDVVYGGDKPEIVGGFVK